MSAMERRPFWPTSLSDWTKVLAVASLLLMFVFGVRLVFVAGAIIVQHASKGPLEHYDLLGYACVASMVVCALLLYRIHKHVEAKIGSRMPQGEERPASVPEV